MSCAVAHLFTEYEDMLRSFRCQDLANLLAHAGQSKNGKKSELLDRCLNILKKGNASIQLKIREIYTQKIAATGNNFNQFISNNSGSNSPDPSIMGNRYINPYSVNNATNNNNNNANYHQFPGSSSFGSMHNNTITNNTRFQNNFQVKFEKLAFYEFLHELQAPIKLQPGNINNRPYSFQFSFFMTTEQANEITGTRQLNNSKLEYSKQIHLRFGFYENIEQVDNLPPNLLVSINGKQAMLPAPKPTSKPNADIIRPGRSIDITTYSRLAPNMANKVELNWTNPENANGRQFCIGIFVFKKLSVQYLLKNLQSKCLDAEVTRQMVRDKLDITDSDFEIETSDLKVSLMCPLMKFRMNTPGRATTCKHVQCFDLESYLMMNEKKPTWNCPVCDQNAPYHHLVIDSLNKQIIANAGDVEEVVFKQDGSWTKIDSNDAKTNSKNKNKNNNTTSNTNTATNMSIDDKTPNNSKNDESCVELICDDTPEKIEPSEPVNIQAETETNKPKKNMCIIDLTIDSSSEEEQEDGELTNANTNLISKIDSSDTTSIVNNNNNNNHTARDTTSELINALRPCAKEAAVSPSQSIISISSSSNSSPASRSTTPIPEDHITEKQKETQTNSKRVTTPSSRSSSIEQPMDLAISPNNKTKTKTTPNITKNGTPAKNSTQPLSNSQLAKGMSIGTSTSSVKGQLAAAATSSPKVATYTNSFSRPTPSLTSIPSIIENTNRSSNSMINSISPNQSTTSSSTISPKRVPNGIPPNINQAKNNNNNNPNLKVNTELSTVERHNNQIRTRDQSQVILNHHKQQQQQHQLQQQQQQQQQRQRMTAQSSTTSNQINRQQHMQRNHEHSLVGSNAIASHKQQIQKRTEHNNHQHHQRMKERALLTLSNEMTKAPSSSSSSSANSVVVNSPISHLNFAHSTPNQISSSKNRHQNMNYSLKEPSIAHRIDNTLKRNSFDNDSSSSSQKKSMNSHHSRHSSHHSHRNSSAAAAAAAMAHSNGNPQNIYMNTNSRAHHNSNQFSANQHSSNYTNRQTSHSPVNGRAHQSPMNSMSPLSPHMTNQQPHYSHTNLPHNYNNGIPNQYQYHTQHSLQQSPRPQQHHAIRHNSHNS